MSTSLDSAALWGPQARSGLGRPAAHSRDEITAAAVAIADADGLPAVSFRRVAAAIGAGAMSLYSYVPDKETLIELMIDRVSGEVVLSPPTGEVVLSPPTGEVVLSPPTGDPVADLRAFARALRAMMRRHPWVPGALAARQTLGPNALAGMDHVLAVLAGTPLDTPAKLELLALLTGLVANAALHEVSQSELARRTGRTPAESLAAEVAYLIGAAQSGRYPHLAAALSAPSPSPNTDPDEVFDRLITRVLTGLLTPTPGS